jgi:hypothetical protein
MPDKSQNTGTGKVQAVAEWATNLSDELLKSVESMNKSAVDASRKFAEAVEDALPSQEEGSRRTIVSAAVDLADRLVTMQHEFLRSVLQNVDDAVEKRSDKQK